MPSLKKSCKVFCFKKGADGLASGFKRQFYLCGIISSLKILFVYDRSYKFHLNGCELRKYICSVK